MGEEKANHGEGVSLVTLADCAVPAGELFPILAQGPVGIARLAAKGEDAGRRGGKDGHGVQFRTLQTRSLLSRIVSKRGFPFAWAINPYRGCEFGCRYCYARYTHEFMGKSDPLLFEREIYIKQQAAWLLRQELKQVRPDEQIAIGTATDPWQPIERRERVTQSLLQVLTECSELTVGIVTKSTLVERDIDLLTRIAVRNRLTVCLTITTPDPQLARVLEPRAPRPDLRFRTVERLREAGLRVGILCSPLMPGITDTAQALERMAVRAKNAGACFFSAQPLFLKPCSRPVFLQFIEEHFPQLRQAYETRYHDRAFVHKAYSERVGALVRAVVRKHGLGERFSEIPRKGVQPVWPVQGELWEGVQRKSA
ncbi:MAG TPA: radical SAM protein [Acidobacteriaceae bacterium]|jgi:DNA repair photolyase|nr:radical SAM protein [Acidobacteriaceae bacterium]